MVILKQLTSHCKPPCTDKVCTCCQKGNKEAPVEPQLWKEAMQISLCYRPTIKWFLVSGVASREHLMWRDLSYTICITQILPQPLELLIGSLLGSFPPVGTIWKGVFLKNQDSWKWPLGHPEVSNPTSCLKHLPWKQVIQCLSCQLLKVFKHGGSVTSLCNPNPLKKPFSLYCVRISYFTHCIHFFCFYCAHLRIIWLYLLCSLSQVVEDSTKYPL